MAETNERPTDRPTDKGSLSRTTGSIATVIVSLCWNNVLPLLLLLLMMVRDNNNNNSGT